MEYDAFERTISRKLKMFKTHYNDDFRAFLRKAKLIFGIFNIYGRKYKGYAFFYKPINSSSKKTDGWITPKNSIETDFINTDLNFNIDKDSFYESIKDILKIKHFNKIKEFVIRLYRNNLYLNTRSYKWNKEKSNLCSNCKNKLETRIHIFQACSTIKDLPAFFERILTSVGLLQSVNMNYFFLYEK